MFIAQKLRNYATYALLCALAVGGVLCTGSYVGSWLVATSEAKYASKQAAENLYLARLDARSQIQQEAAANESLPVLAQKAQETALRYASIDYQCDLWVMGWAVLAGAVLAMLSVYIDGEERLELFLALAITVVGIIFLRSFLSAFWGGIWGWLTVPLAGHTHGLWLLAIFVVCLSVAAIYYDFFRSTPVAPTE